MTIEQSFNLTNFIATPTGDRHKDVDHDDRIVRECPPPPRPNNNYFGLDFHPVHSSNSERLNALADPSLPHISRSFDDDDDDEFNGLVLIAPGDMNGDIFFRSIEYNNDLHRSHEHQPSPRRRINLQPRMSSRSRSSTRESNFALPALSNSSVLLRPRPMRPGGM